MTPTTHEILAHACAITGLDHTDATLLRHGENTIYALPGKVVARIGRRGQAATAVAEITAARWISGHGVPTTTPLDHIDQPVVVDDRPVTFWDRLPPHRAATPHEVAIVLRRLHSLPTGDCPLPALDPFTRLDARITAAPAQHRGWLDEHLHRLRERYRALPAGLPWCPIHGDAWTDNIAHTDDGLVLLDLERAALGPPEWDLVHMANEHHSFGWLTHEDYTDYCATYGHDVTTWAGYPTLRDIRELRQVLYAYQVATTPDRRAQADHRLACIRGDTGPRPWRGWSTMDF